MGLSDRLDRVEEEPTPYRDIDVYLGIDVSEEVAALTQRILTAQQAIQDRKAKTDRLAKKADVAELEEQIAGLEARIAELEEKNVDALVTLRVTKLDPELYAELEGRFPPRLNSALDLARGYNVDQVVKASAPLAIAEVDGETVTALTEQLAARLWRQVSGYDLARIRDLTLYLNDVGPMLAVDNAKKARSVSVTPSTPPSDSASASNASTAGSRRQSPSTSTTKKAASPKR